MDNFEDVEQEVMFHDADCVSAVVRHLVEMSFDDFKKLDGELQLKALKMLSAFHYWDDVVSRKAEQKKQAELAERHRLGFEE